MDSDIFDWCSSNACISSSAKFLECTTASMANGLFESCRLLSGASHSVEASRVKIGIHWFQSGHLLYSIRHDNFSVCLSVVQTRPSKGFVARYEQDLLSRGGKPTSHDGLFESQSGWCTKSQRMVVLVRTNNSKCKCIACRRQKQLTCVCTDR